MSSTDDRIEPNAIRRGSDAGSHASSNTGTDASSDTGTHTSSDTGTHASSDTGTYDDSGPNSGASGLTISCRRPSGSRCWCLADVFDLDGARLTGGGGVADGDTSVTG